MKDMINDHSILIEVVLSQGSTYLSNLSDKHLALCFYSLFTYILYYNHPFQIIIFTVSHIRSTASLAIPTSIRYQSHIHSIRITSIPICNKHISQE